MRRGRSFRRAVHSIFSEQAGQTPHAIAIDGPAGSVTYAELERRSSVMAGGLLAAGVRPGDIVVTALERGAEVLAAYLAILKVGAAYCSLDLADPPTRHQWTLEDSQPSALITTRSIDQSLPKNAIPRLYVEEITDHTFVPAPPIDVDINAAACVMYTSGSTGRPKAALIPHRGIVRLFAEDTFIPFGPDMRMLAHSPMHFDAITYEAWGPLLHGGTTVPFGGGAVPSLHELREHIFKYRVNTLFFGPALFNIIVDEDVHLLDPVRTIMIGGDAVSASHVRKAQPLLPHIQFVNAYGPTETTTFATMYSIPRPFAPEAASVPIGTPITATTCYVLDEQLQPVKAGEEGQLFVGGDGVALGYLNLPEATAQRFLPDPFAGDPSARMYRTGDRCRVLPDGNIDFLGRADGQVKIGGRRIELGEIEASVQRFPGVLQCVVGIHEEGPEKHIVCYYVVQKGDNASPDVSETELRRHLQERLPSYLVPRDLIAVSEIPRKPNGKIDRRALPAPTRRIQTDGGGCAKSPEEEQLIELWKQSLEDTHVGPESCFYAAGGTSLGAVRLCCAIERHTGKFIDIDTLVANSTPRKLAARLFAGEEKQAQRALRLNTGSGSPILFCAPGQIWNPNSLRQIASHLEQVATAISISLPGLEDSGEVLRETEVTARYAIAKIRAYQPSGPYHLFGYSYGGVIVFEMARQLQAMGERIGALILADSYLASEHGYYKPGWWRALVHTRQIVRGGPRLLSRRLRERTERLRNAVIQPAASDKAGLLFDAAQRLAHQAFLNYRPGPYSGDVLLLRAKEQFEWMQFARQLPLGGWARVVKGKLEVKDIPGNHLAMLLDPHAGVVAQRVGEYLENVCAMDRASSAALDGREAHAKETQAVVGSLK